MAHRRRRSLPGGRSGGLQLQFKFKLESSSLRSRGLELCSGGERHGVALLGGVEHGDRVRGLGHQLPEVCRHAQVRPTVAVPGNDRLGERAGRPAVRDLPQATLAAQATVKYINSQLGGVHGHPVQLSTCYIAAVEAQGTTCGDQMVNTKGVEVIAEGLDAVGNASMYGVVNGAISTLVGVSADPADDTGKNVFELEGSGTSATVAFGPFLRSQYPNDKTIAIAYQNLPGAVPISQAIQKSAQAERVHRHDDPVLLDRDRPDRPGDADGAGADHGP